MSTADVKPAVWQPAMMQGSAPRSIESSILVPVAEAEPVACQLRAQLGRSAIWGVPGAYDGPLPVRPAGCDHRRGDLDSAAAVASVSAFDCGLACAGWFGQDVVWLAPEPAGPFPALTCAVHAAFPQFPPFGAVYADVVAPMAVPMRFARPRRR